MAPVSGATTTRSLPPGAAAKPGSKPPKPSSVSTATAKFQTFQGREPRTPGPALIGPTMAITSKDLTRRKLLNPAMIALVFFFSGVVALVYEVLWQRRFALVFGSSATATAAVLAAYFAGLALGSWGVFSAKAQRIRPLRMYAILECGIAVGAVLVELLIRGFDQIQ